MHGWKTAAPTVQQHHASAFSVWVLTEEQCWMVQAAWEPLILHLHQAAADWSAQQQGNGRYGPSALNLSTLGLKSLHDPLFTPALFLLSASYQIMVSRLHYELGVHCFVQLSDHRSQCATHSVSSVPVLKAYRCGNMFGCIHHNILLQLF